MSSRHKTGARVIDLCTYLKRKREVAAAAAAPSSVLLRERIAALAKFIVDLDNDKKNGVNSAGAITPLHE